MLKLPLLVLSRILVWGLVAPASLVAGGNVCSTSQQQIDVGAVDASFNANGLGTGVTDGVYSYFLSVHNLASPMGKLIRVPLNGFAQSNVQILDLGAVDPDLRGYAPGDGFYFGGYVYCATLRYTFGSTMVGKIARVDVSNFTPSGVTVLDLSSVNTRLRGFLGAFTDGSYGYIVPGQSASGVYEGLAGRFLLSSFSTAGVNTIDLTSIDPSLKQFVYGFSDGRYSYLLGMGDCSGAKIVRLDSQSFIPGSVVVLDITGGYDTQIKNFNSGFTDGTYNYFVGSGCGTPDIGKILRIPKNNFAIAAITLLDLGVMDPQLVAFYQSFVDQTHAVLVPSTHTKAARINLSNFTLGAVSVINLPSTNTVGFASSANSCYYFAASNWNPSYSTPTITRVCNVTCFDTVVSGSAIGDPHFTAFDGEEFDFMGEHGRIYSLYSSSTVQINARFKKASRPHLYPNYENPGFMDEIGVRYGNHRFSYAIQSHPVINGEPVPLPAFKTIEVELMNPFVLVRISPNRILELHMGGMVSGSSYQYSVRLSHHNDDWMEHYMNIAMSVASSESSGGLLGQTRVVQSNSLPTSSVGIGADSLGYTNREDGQKKNWDAVVNALPSLHLIKDRDIFGMKESDLADILNQ